MGGGFRGTTGVHQKCNLLFAKAFGGSGKLALPGMTAVLRTRCTLERSSQFAQNLPSERRFDFYEIGALTGLHSDSVGFRMAEGSLPLSPMPGHVADHLTPEAHPIAADAHAERDLCTIGTFGEANRSVPWMLVALKVRGLCFLRS